EGLGGGKVFTKFFPDAAHGGGWSDWLALEDNNPSVKIGRASCRERTAISAGPGAIRMNVIGLDNEGLGGGKVFNKFFPEAASGGGWSDWLALEDNNPSVRRVWPVGAPVTALSTGGGAPSLYVIGLSNEGLGGGKVFTKFFPDAAHGGGWSDWLALEDNNPSV